MTEPAAGEDARWSEDDRASCTGRVGPVAEYLRFYQKGDIKHSNSIGQTR